MTTTQTPSTHTAAGRTAYFEMLLGQEHTLRLEETSAVFGVTYGERLRGQRNANRTRADLNAAIGVMSMDDLVAFHAYRKQALGL